jgi:hypothetical protein
MSQRRASSSAQQTTPADNRYRQAQRLCRGKTQLVRCFRERTPYLPDKPFSGGHSVVTDLTFGNPR